MSQIFSCRVCGSFALREVADYSELYRVTSDCKPFDPGGRLVICQECGAVQKPSDQKWLDETSDIYANYSAYFQSDGIEQAVFDANSGEPSLRSEVVLDKMSTLIEIPKSGDLIDIGCGSGAFLASFSGKIDGWNLFGQDLTENHLSHLKSIYNFQKLYTCDIQEITKKFDLVSMVHVLEHIPNPVSALKTAKKLLKPNGAILIQVPNCRITPLDLLVADHASHFTIRDFKQMLAHAGLNALTISDQWVTKELSIVAVASDFDELSIEQTPPDQITETNAFVEKQVAWLKSTVEIAKREADQKEAFGIFGTSVAAIWLYGQLGKKIAYFVDEDENRIGKSLHGLPVYDPRDVPKNGTVFLALIPSVAKMVAAKMEKHDVKCCAVAEL